MKDKYLYIKIPYQEDEPLYTELLKEKVEQRELTLFVRKLLEAYHKDIDVRDVFDRYMEQNSAAGCILKCIESVMLEQSRLTMLLDAMQNEVDVGVEVVTKKVDGKGSIKLNNGISKDVALKRDRGNDVDGVSGVNMSDAVDTLDDFGLSIGKTESKSEAEKQFMELFNSMTVK